MIDDGSTDNTKTIVNSINDNRLIYIKHNKNKGASAARNTGIKNTYGDYIAFLDDDDEWLPNKLQIQVERIENLSIEFGILYCWMDYFENGELVYEHHPELRGYVFGEILHKQ